MKQSVSQLIALVMIVVIGPQTFAQRREASVRATLGERMVYLGDVVQLVVDVDDGEIDSPPSIESTEAYSIAYSGMRNRSFKGIQIINGRRRESSQLGQSFFYSLTPLQAGEMTIAPIQVTIDGKQFQTVAVALRVVEPAKNLTDVRVTLEVDNDAPFVGEPITLTLTIARSPTITMTDASVRMLGRENQFDVALEDSATARRRAQMEFLGSPAEFLTRQDVIDGVVFETFTLTRTLTPRHAGEQTIGPVVMLFDVGSSRSRRQQRAALQSSAPELHVREVPLEGQPANYDGLVGQYSIRATADVREVAVGDPVALRVYIQGPKPIERVRAPDVMRDPAFADGFRMASDDVEAERTGGSVVFTYTIRAARDEITSIPSIALPFFDSERGQYTVVHTKAIPLTVRKTRVVTASDGQGDAVDTESGRTIESAEAGVRHNEAGVSLLRDERRGVRVFLRSPLVIGLGAAPIGMYAFALGGAAWRRRANSASGARRRAWQEAKDLLSCAERGENVADACARAIELCVSAVCRGRATVVTPDEATAMLSGHDHILAERVRIFLERCDAARFGANNEDEAQLVAEAREVMNALDRMSNTRGAA